jgi:Zn-dependent protease with chaperone function
MDRKMIISWCLLLAVAVTLLTAGPIAASRQKDEENMGREYAADVEREAKLVTTGEAVERVKRIGQELAEIANSVEVPALYGSPEICKFRYQFKVVEDKDVNAFSLPGGIIYVNTGLIDLVESDDELAGVLAHEIAHAAHHHMSYLLKKSSSADRYVALVALAGILGNVRSRDLNNLLLGAQMMKIGKLSGYTQEAERDADRTAVAYLARSKYNPEGMLTFMKKLDAKREEGPGFSLGIYQTHPAPHRRVSAITKAMQEAGLNPDLRRIQGVAYAKCVPADEAAGHYQVKLGERVLFEPAPLRDGACSKDRAEAIAKRINEALDAGMKPADLFEDTARRAILAKGAELLRVEKEDAALSAKGEAALLKKARSALEYAIWADWLCNGCAKQEELAGG